MAPENLCPIHGPYDASLGACPYPHNNQSGRPVPPTPLDEDDLPTDLGGYDHQTAPTALPRYEEVGETEIPPHRKSTRGILDMEDEDATQLGRGRNEDETELEHVTPGPLAMLWVTEGPRRGKFYPIRHGTKIGRREGNLILDDPKVSGLHAKFTMEGEDFYIWDFGSANGTYVNGKKIREAVLLEENDLVKIGDSIFVVKLLVSKPKRKQSRVPEVKKTVKPKGGHRS
jgi:pSer/pThr/pTyr-binding forkhead associated (FHA) protein